MKDLKDFDIVILNLNVGTYVYEYVLGDNFFQYFESQIVEKGLVKAQINLEKNERLIRLEFKLEGKVELVCDKSLNKFDEPILVQEQIIYKFGEEQKEETEELFVILRNTYSINVANFLLEFVSFAVPMRKIHPDLRQEDAKADSGLVFSTSSVQTSEAKSDTESDLPIDPRWEALKKLKK
ncbi:MAG: DUF177 domain-containing protein [Cytophagales bacterium]|nr:MAG: DUF177 domain-containing protein [Cytophagales bacterium]TAF60304.1 MAG: DUF177 domain-containing protein [Cytophagales bacterium]